MFVDAQGSKFESIKGRKATVIHDDCGNFEDGEIVVILEESVAPFCLSIDHYIKGKNGTDNYETDLFWPLCAEEELIIEGDEE